MVKPHLTGTDTKGNPFVITADSRDPGCQKSQTRQPASNLEADLSAGPENWINAHASDRHGGHEHGELELNGGINVFTGTGYELHSQSASAISQMAERDPWP